MAELFTLSYVLMVHRSEPRPTRSVPGSLLPDLLTEPAVVLNRTASGVHRDPTAWHV
jgi:hypothetical protein